MYLDEYEPVTKEGEGEKGTKTETERKGVIVRETQRVRKIQNHRDNHRHTNTNTQGMEYPFFSGGVSIQS